MLVQRDREHVRVDRRFARVAAGERVCGEPDGRRCESVGRWELAGAAGGGVGGERGVFRDGGGCEFDAAGEDGVDVRADWAG